MTPRRAGLAALAALALWALAERPAHADSVAFHGVTAGYFEAPIITWRDIPFRTVVRQRFDYSCGSAALATLLRHHYGRDIGEAEAFEAMWRVGDQEKIRRLGFSLLDMKRYLDAIGFRSDGYQISLDQLAKFNRPAIVLIDLGAYKHFVVIKGVTADSVLLGDPNRGLRIEQRAVFERQWNGVAFLIREAPVEGRFNAADEWAQLNRLAPSPEPASISQTLRDLAPIHQLTPLRLIPFYGP